MKIYMADLVYDTLPTEHAVPLNISIIAAYIHKKLGNDLDIRLYKYPKDLEKALISDPPDVLALSHYSWNSRLSLLFMQKAKQIKPSIITIMGGPNIPLYESGMREFFINNPAVDYHIIHEGQWPFYHLLCALLAGDEPLDIEGCASLKGDELRYRPQNFRSMSKEIDYVSPYLTGLLDKFLIEDKMIPLIETNRGCPYSCVYCARGIPDLNPIRVIPIEIVKEEIDYVAR